MIADRSEAVIEASH